MRRIPIGILGLIQRGKHTASVPFAHHLELKNSLPQGRTEADFGSGA